MCLYRVHGSQFLWMVGLPADTLACLALRVANHTETRKARLPHRVAEVEQSFVFARRPTIMDGNNPANFTDAADLQRSAPSCDLFTMSYISVSDNEESFASHSCVPNIAFTVSRSERIKPYNAVKQSEVLSRLQRMGYAFKKQAHMCGLRAADSRMQRYTCKLCA